MKRILVLAVLAGCASRPPEVVAPTAGGILASHGASNVDNAPKEDLRMVPPEVYMRTYLQLFGGLVPVEAQKRARENQGSQLFDTWDDYVSALGFPDYRLDTPRQLQTNALMVATFERLGIALCDRAIEHDWKAKEPVAMKDRAVFAFDVPKGELAEAAFASRFDVLHRTFLGYPAALAPTNRTTRFYQLYRDIETNHPKAGKSKFNPQEAAWAAVCYGLVRHPEFQLY